MGAWLEREWQRLGGLALIFLPLAALYALAVLVRRFAYRTRLLPAWRARVPVIVVGNITAGGTGKTPLTLAILEALERHGFSPGVVSRGYGRVPRGVNDPLGVVRVYPDVATPEHFGDEPVLIARRSRVPVYVSPDRPAAARALLESHPEVDVLVSDDGLQHYALARDIEIAVVDGERRFGNGLLLPAGPLREPVSRLASVDAVVVAGEAAGTVPGSPQFTMRLGHDRFVGLGGRQEASVEEFALAARGRKVVAIAGIAYPERFFEHLADLGIAARTVAFPDPHAFQPAELRLPGAELVVMTEKDAVKCAAYADSRMWFLRVDAIVARGLEELLVARLQTLARSPDGPQAA
ncbi:MAG TPA: tetraacyldisaccharide 4'-kinase [Usitatibacter sp.]|nr:tetraacyldisaccharide 4'-kinase [Usitatibacter sp.]